MMNLLNLPLFFSGADLRNGVLRHNAQKKIGGASLKVVNFCFKMG